MNLFIDTCSWLKLDLLDELKLFNPKLIFNHFDIHITHQLLDEINHFRVKTILINQTEIHPIGNIRVYEDAIACNLDPADASLLSHGNKIDDALLISEDGGVLNFGMIYHFKCIELIDLFCVFTDLEIISKKNLIQIAKFMKENENVTKKKFKEINAWRSTH